MKQILAGIFTVILVIGFVLIIYAASKKAIVFNRMEENHVMALEFNGKFFGFKICSQERDFVRKGSNTEKWRIERKDGGPETTWLEDKGLYAVGKKDFPLWPLVQARQFTIRRNSNYVIHPTKPGEVLRYVIYEDNISDTKLPLLITHSFETAEVNTAANADDKGTKEGDEVFIVTTVVGSFQVQLEIFNPYLAIYETPDFMDNVNGTLQSAGKDVISGLSYSQLIRARSEGNKGLKASFGNKLKELVSESLERYGIRVLDVDFLDHKVIDPDVEKDLQLAQREKLQANARSIRGKSEKEYDQERAIGKAAEIKELRKESGDNPEIIIAEIKRREFVDGLEKYRGNNLAIGAPNPAVIIDGRGEEQKKKDEPKTKKA